MRVCLYACVNACVRACVRLRVYARAFNVLKREFAGRLESMFLFYIYIYKVIGFEEIERLTNGILSFR